MAFVSVDWTTIFVLILLFLSENTLLTSSKSAGDSNSLQTKSSGFQRVTLNADNPFFNKHPTTSDYHDNPFLIITTTPATDSSRNSSTHESGSNSFLIDESIPDVHRDVTSYIHNPFLISIIETIKNKNPSTSNITHPLRPNENIPNIADKNNNNEEQSSTIPGEQAPKPSVTPPINLIDIRRKSDIKCEEYGKQFLDTAEDQFIAGTNTHSRATRSSPLDLSDFLDLSNFTLGVAGGTDTAPAEFPHMVGLGKILNDGSFMFYCGGTLISPSWVLTAAHCTHGPNGGPTLVKIGFHDINDNKTGTDMVIKRAIRHPSYKPPELYADIALIELQRAVTFTTSTKPACLHQLNDTVPKNVWVSGWGFTEYGGEHTDIPQKAELTIIDNIACSMTHNTSTSIPNGLSPSMICAGDPDGGWVKDTCQGDSGGPLQVSHPKYSNFFQIIGITSFGIGCAIVNSPGVYTRVSHYLNWIEDIVWPNN